MDYTIEYRGKSEDAYVVGNLPAATADAEASEGAPLGIVITERDGWFHALDADENYWGSGSTPEAATRYLIGAVLDPREGR